MATDPSVKTDVNNQQEVGAPVVVVPDIAGQPLPYDRELPQMGGKFVRNPKTGELTEVTVVDKEVEVEKTEKPAAKTTAHKKGE